MGNGDRLLDLRDSLLCHILQPTAGGFMASVAALSPHRSASFHDRGGSDGGRLFEVVDRIGVDDSGGWSGGGLLFDCFGSGSLSLQSL